MGEARSDNNNNGVTIPKLQMEYVLSVPPLKVTEPRLVREVMVMSSDESDDTTNNDSIIISSAISGCCYHIVLYLTMKNDDDDDDALLMAGWLKESLAVALSDHPLLAGRIGRRRRRDEEDGGERERERGYLSMEIVSNDSGVRMLEGRMLMRMSEFMGLSHEKQGDVVFWKEVDELHPQFSPLLYVQVSRFECGGYSIGISCSLLLSEFFMVDNFLKKWADTHINIKTQTQTKTPIFYHPHLKNPELSPPTCTITKNEVRSITFKVTCCEDAKFNHHESWRELATICVEKAEQKLERKMGEILWLWMMDPSCEALRIRVERCSRSSITNSSSYNYTTSLWDDFGEYEVAFGEGKKPVFVSRWIGGSISDEGHVMVVPHRNHINFSALTVLVSFPERNNGV